MNNSQSYQSQISDYFKLTYLYVAIGILLTGLASYIGGPLLMPLLTGLYANKFFWFGVIAVQLLFVVIVSAMAQATNRAVALGGYLFFTVFEGLILAPVLLLADPKAVIAAFLSAGGLFGAMSIIGYTTKADLSQKRSLLFGLTIALIVAGVINIFMASGVVSLIISVATIIVFSGWTAYDNQNIKRALENTTANDEHSIAVMGAFSLYLDFLNLMISFLRIFSNR